MVDWRLIIMLFSRKEISALQAENYSLERQLFSYQKSIAYAHSRRTYSDDVGTPDGHDEEYLSYYKERNYSIGDRSLSTDTEYAWKRSRTFTGSVPSPPGSTWKNFSGFVRYLGVLVRRAFWLSSLVIYLDIAEKFPPGRVSPLSVLMPLEWVLSESFDYSFTITTVTCSRT